MAGPPDGTMGTDRRSGRPVIRQGGRWVHADTAKLTEDQGKSQGYARLMADAEQRYYRAVQQGYNPAGPRNTVASVLEGLPFGGLDGLGAVVRDDAGDLGRQAELQFSDAQLKAMSGAAAPEAEVKRGVKTFFPRPGENPSVIGPEKRQARREAFDAARRRAGPAGAEIETPGRPAGAPRGGPPSTAPRPSAVQNNTWSTLTQQGVITRQGERGSATNPYVATTPEMMEGLRRRRPGSYVIAPDGRYGIIE